MTESTTSAARRLQPVGKRRRRKRLRNVDPQASTRVEILKSAAAAFRRLGYHGATVEQIAAALHMKKGNLYYYFKNKQELLFFCQDHSLDRLIDAAQSISALTDIPEDEKLMINSSRSVIAVGLAELDARIARAAQDGEAEVAHFRRAVELQDKLGYMEPPEWHYSVREALGAALLRHGNAAEAEAVFRKDLEMNPRNGRSLFGLLEALQAQQKFSSIEWVKREFADAWKHSPLKLAVTDL